MQDTFCEGLVPRATPTRRDIFPPNQERHRRFFSKDYSRNALSLPLAALLAMVCEDQRTKRLQPSRRKTRPLAMLCCRKASGFKIARSMRNSPICYEHLPHWPQTMPGADNAVRVHDVAIFSACKACGAFLSPPTVQKRPISIHSTTYPLRYTDALYVRYWPLIMDDIGTNTRMGGIPPLPRHPLRWTLPSSAKHLAMAACGWGIL